MADTDKTLTVLGWFVLITLMCAIARQLSEQTQLNLTPSLFGASWNRPGSSHRLLEKFTNGSEYIVSGKPVDISPLWPPGYEYLLAAPMMISNMLGYMNPLLPPQLLQIALWVFSCILFTKIVSK